MCYGNFPEVGFSRTGGRSTIPPLALYVYVGQLSTLIEQTGWVARGVLILLLAFPYFPGRLIFQKLRLFSRLNRQTTLFLRVFRAGRGLPEPKAVGSLGSPLEAVYTAGYQELASQLTGEQSRTAA